LRVFASAPGKITLFGEHAVVYGEPAITYTIDKRVHVHLKVGGDSTIKIEARGLQVGGAKLVISGEKIEAEVDAQSLMESLSYVHKALEIASEYCGESKGVEILVESELPVGAGLGTSAAVSAATIAAFCKAMEKELSLEELARLAHRVEIEVQGSASPMDTMTVTYGGLLYIKPAERSFERLEWGSLPVVVGFTPRESNTGKLVAGVRRLVEREEDLIMEIIRTIGRLVDRAREALEEENLERVGSLMNVNHGLLEALGVSTVKLNEMVYAARAAGALGAKLTGAGGGGCMVALCPGKEEEVKASLRAVGGIPLECTFSSRGVEVRVVG